jgi:trk system potassium uptake protein TrkH
LDTQTTSLDRALSDHRPPSDARLAGALVWAWMIAGANACIVQQLDDSKLQGNALSADRALFTAINAATLSGFAQSIPVEQYLLPARLAVLALMLAGIFVTLVVAGLALTRALRWSYSPTRIVLGALAAMLLAIGGGTLALSSADTGLFEPIFTATAAFGNCGLPLNWTAPTPATLHLVLLPLAVLGGLGLPVLMDLTAVIVLRRPASRHSRAVVAWSAGVYLASVAIFILLMPGTFRDRLTLASFASIDARTLGLPLPFADLSRIVQWLLMGLMIIGAAPAGTGGGVKITVLPHLFAGVRSALRGRAVDRIFGITLVWIGLYLLLALLTFLTLLALQPQLPADRLLFITISALSNIGLSHDAISMTGAPLVVLSAAMLVGRMVPWLVLWWLATTTRDAEIAVG